MGHYERMVFKPSNSFINSVGIRLGAGYSIIWTADGGMNYSFNVFTFTGCKTNHLEIGAGVLYAPWTSTKEYEIFPSFNLSYRHHKPGGPLILRTGIGWPEAAHISVGYYF